MSPRDKLKVVKSPQTHILLAEMEDGEGFKRICSCCQITKWPKHQIETRFFMSKTFQVHLSMFDMFFVLDVLFKTGLKHKFCQTGLPEPKGPDSVCAIFRYTTTHIFQGLYDRPTTPFAQQSCDKKNTSQVL